MSQVVYAAIAAIKGSCTFLVQNNIIVPILFFIAEKLFDLWKTKVKPIYDISEIEAYLHEKGYC